MAPRVALEFVQDPIDLSFFMYSKVKYLGVFLDPKLSFICHMDYIKRQVGARLAAMRALTSLPHSAGVRISRTLFIATIRPLFHYGFMVYPLAGTRVKSTMDSLYRTSAKAALGFTSRAPNHTSLAELGLNPLPFEVNMLLARLGDKIMRMPAHPLHQQLDAYITNYTQEIGRRRLYQNGKCLLLAMAKSVRKTLGTNQEGRYIVSPMVPSPYNNPPWADHPIKFDIYKPFPNKEEAPVDEYRELVQDRIDILTDPNTASFYTDGSVDEEGKVGAAYVFGEEVLRHRLSDCASIAQAELAAIHQCVLRANSLPNTEVLINSDSMAAILALSKRDVKDNHSQIFEILNAAAGSPAKSITLNWVPSHIGIAGNERADLEAKAASALPDITLVVEKPRSLIKAQTKKGPGSTSELMAVCTKVSSIWANGLKRTENTRAALDGHPRFLQRQILRLRLRSRPPSNYEGGMLHNCIGCGADNSAGPAHFLSECSRYPAARANLLSHLTRAQLDLPHFNRAQAIINSQATRGYKELVALLLLDPYK